MKIAIDILPRSANLLNMKITIGNQFTRNGETWTVLTDKIDGDKGRFFFFAGGVAANGAGLFSSFRKSKITRKNGWARK